MPAGPDSGSRGPISRIQEGDATCAANQALHPEAADLMAKIRANDTTCPRSRTALPDQVRRQDQRPGLHGLPVDRRADGGHCPTLAEHMTATDKKWFTFTNGVPHRVARSGDLTTVIDFPSSTCPGGADHQSSRQASFPAAFQAIWGISGPGGAPRLTRLWPPDPIQLQPTYALAKAAFDAQPQIRVLFDNGAGNRGTRERSAARLRSRYASAARPKPGWSASAPWARRPASGSATGIGKLGVRSARAAGPTPGVPRLARAVVEQDADLGLRVEGRLGQGVRGLQLDRSGGRVASGGGAPPGPLIPDRLEGRGGSSPGPPTIW